MNKNEKTTSIRFSPDTDSKIAWLLEEDRKQSKRVGIKPRNRTQIIEEAIDTLYFKTINDTQDADVVKRIASMVDDIVSSSMNNLKKTIDDIWFMARKNELGNKLLYRSPGIIPPPPSITDAINIIINEESGWNSALEEYMYDTENKERFERYHAK